MLEVSITVQLALQPRPLPAHRHLEEGELVPHRGQIGPRRHHLLEDGLRHRDGRVLGEVGAAEPALAVDLPVARLQICLLYTSSVRRSASLPE